jgi:outer membrane lipoprotein-sorting protein
MKKIVLILLFALFATLGFAGQGEQPAGKTMAKAARWSGTVDRIDKDNSTLTVRKRGGTISKTINFDASTKWLKRDGKTPLDMSAVKEGDLVVCNGKTEGAKFIAEEIVDRTPK